MRNRIYLPMPYIGLDRHPIYHKRDVSSIAHLHVGLLAYLMVKTIRHQLKKQNINNSWQ
ncbi:MAG: hypothetical protein IPO27_08040 [Bacteroidetes bacterium]|nr:hypothetical protein [Bacteroidota bacterium]